VADINQRGHLPRHSGKHVRGDADHLERSDLRPELRTHFLDLNRGATLGARVGQVEVLMRRLYDERMRLTGQNGLSDYGVGFMNFLYAFQLSSTARQDPPPAGAVRVRTAGRGETQ
jgi:hypothetical protein